MADEKFEQVPFIAVVNNGRFRHQGVWYTKKLDSETAANAIRVNDGGRKFFSGLVQVEAERNRASTIAF